MEVKIKNIVDGTGDGPQNSVKEGGVVLPPSFSHNQYNEVGVHWLRISFANKHIEDIIKFISGMWGKPDQDGYGLWSYDSRYVWNSGVSLNYDTDKERSLTVHRARCTLDCPGSSLDLLSIPDLFLLLEFCGFIDGKCTRIDIFFDDYKKTVSFEQLKQAAKRGDYSGLRDFQIRTAYKRIESGVEMSRCEVSFGKRGQRGNGKYIRWYKKDLESNGEINCDRWEVEFTQDKAHSVFMKLSQSRLIEEFVTICGAVIAGCITFIHRTGEKNIRRLKRYSWWDHILEILGGELSIRTKRKKDTIQGKISWIKKNVAPSLACLRRIFISDRALFRWLFDVCHEGDGRMSPYVRQLSERYEKTMNYRWGEIQRDEEKEFDLMSV